VTNIESKGLSIKWAPSYSGSINVGGGSKKSKPSQKSSTGAKKKKNSDPAKAPTAQKKKRRSRGGKKPQNLEKGEKAQNLKEQISSESDDSDYTKSDEELVGSKHEEGKRHKEKHGKRHKESMIGPSIQANEHTVAIFDELGRRFKVMKRVDNKPRAFRNVMMVVGKDFEDIETPNESFGIHKILLESYSQKTPVFLTMQTHSQKAKVVSSVSPLINENKVSALFTIQGNEPLLLTRGDPFSIKLRNKDARFVGHEDIFDMDPVVDKHPDSSVFNVPVSLYDESLQHLYKSHRVPTPHAVLILRKNHSQDVFLVEGVEVYLHMKPGSIPSTHLHIAGYPSTAGTMNPHVSRALIVETHVDGGHKEVLHNALKSVLLEKSRGAALATSFDNHIKDPESMIHWGGMTGSLVAYSVIQLLIANKDILSLNSPVFLAKVLASDENGSLLVNEVIDIMSKLKVEEESNNDVPVFPSLLQLLSHTSGLPSSSLSSSKEEALALYDSVIDQLKRVVSPEPETTGEFGAEQEGAEASAQPASTENTVRTSPSDVYKGLEERFLESLKTITAPLNPPNAVVGEWDNTTEACILAMFLYRYAKKSKFPEEMINAVVARLNAGIQIQWGLTLDDSGKRTETPNNPYNLVSGASSRRVDLVGFVKKLTEELTVKPFSESAFAIQLSNPIKTEGVPGHSHVAWKEEIVGSSSLIHTGTTEVGIHGVLVVLIPDLDFWAVIVDAPTVSSDAAGLDQGQLLDLVKESLYPVLKDVKLPSKSSFHKGNKLENARYVRTADEVEVDPGFDLKTIVDFSTTYLSPFSDITGKNLVKLTLEPVEEYPSSRIRLVITAGPSQQTSFEVVLDYKRNGFFIVRSDNTLGDEVLITKDQVALPNDEVFIASSEIMPKIQEYQQLVKTIKDRAKKDIFKGPLSTMSNFISKPSELSIVTEKPKPLPRDTESTEASIGVRVGPILGAVALGGLATAGAIGLSRALWYGPYSPYGMYPPYPIAPGTVWYGPGSAYGMYPPNLWFGYGSPYGVYPPRGLPGYVRWYGPGSRWGARPPLSHRYAYPQRWGPRWNQNRGYGRIGFDGRGGGIRGYGPR
jgi:hypothetical protein